MHFLTTQSLLKDFNYLAGHQNVPREASTGFAVVKTGLPNLYRLSTGIAAVKRGVTIVYMLVEVQQVSFDCCKPCCKFVELL